MVKADAFAMRSFVFGLTNIDQLIVLKESRLMECWLVVKNQRTGFFHDENLFQTNLYPSEFFINKTFLVCKIVDIVLGFLQTSLLANVWFFYLIYGIF